MPKLFLPQATLEEWIGSETADLQEDRLWVAAEKTAYPLTPAVHFKAVVSGSDEAALLDRVKTQAQLLELSAEQLEDSVLLGENAYEVVPGYVTEVTPPAGAKKGTSEADLLAEFLLNKLS